MLRSLTVHLNRGKRRTWPAGVAWEYSINDDTGNLVVTVHNDITIYNAHTWNRLEVIDETPKAVV